MSNIISQNYTDDKEISNSINAFFKRFLVTSALKSANAYKQKGFSVKDIFQYIFCLIFSHQSMYMDSKTGKSMRGFASDTVYRFQNAVHINWIRFTTILSATIMRKEFVPATGEDRINALVIDDSVFDRNRSKHVELLARIFDHAHHLYLYGFRMMTLGWTDGNSFLPVNGVLLSSENNKNRINPAKDVDRRSAGYKRRVLSQTKGTEVILQLLKAAKTAKIPADYVLFDSWFTSLASLHAIKKIGYDVIGMVKKTEKMYFTYNGAKMSLPQIYRNSKKRRGRSRYLLSVIVDVVKDGKTIPAKVVYVRNRSNRKDYLCLISTNVELSEEEIIRIYGKRWKIEVFFKVCKSYLGLARECRSLSYDAMTAHMAVVFTRYMMLSVQNRNTEDPCSLGEIFAYFCEELADITFKEALSLLLSLLRKFLEENMDVSEKMIDEMVEKFIQMLPTPMKRNIIGKVA